MRMLICALDRASNILAATPELDAMPAPTMETFAILDSWVMLSQCSLSLFSSSRRTVSSSWPLATVKLMSLVLLRPMD